MHYVLQQKFENDSSSYRKLEDCTLHIVHVLHTLHICDVQPLNTALHTATVGNTKALRASTVAEAKPVSVGRSRWSLLLLAFARQQSLEKHQAGRRHVGERVILNSPWNTQVDDMRPPVSRQRRYCFTWNNYPLDAEEQLRSLAERKRIVVPRGNICVVSTAAICHSTASIRHIILFSKVELALRTSTKIRK